MAGVFINSAPLVLKSVPIWAINCMIFLARTAIMALSTFRKDT